MPEDVGYKQVYKMRQLVKGAKHITVAIPYQVIERQATIHGLTVEEFIVKYEAVAEYNGFDGVHYTFQLTEEK